MASATNCRQVLGKSSSGISLWNDELAVGWPQCAML